MPTVTGSTRKQAGLYYDKGGAVLNVLHPEFGVLADGSIETTKLQAALDYAGTLGRATVLMPDALYKIDSELLPPSNCQIIMGSSARLQQTVAGKGGFKVVQKDNVWIHCNGAQIYGPGVWSNAWVSISGHDERGVMFYGATNSGISSPFIRNWGLAGVVILGGNNVRVLNPVVEGTHALGSPLALLASYQFAFLVIHDGTYGAFDNILIDSPEGYNVNFGINTVENVALSVGSLKVPNANFHDIIGQHAGYIGTSHTHLPNFKAARCGLDGCKIYSGVANEQIKHTTIHNFDISDCGSGQAIEFGVSNSGFVRDCAVSGVVRDCARGVTVDGDVRRCDAMVKVYSVTQRALYVSQSTAIGPSDCKWDVDLYSAGDKGVLIDSANSARNYLRVKARQASVLGGGHWMVGIHACTSIDLDIDRIDDDLGGITYGVYCETGAKGVRFFGTPKIYGYTNSAIRCDATASIADQAQWHCSGGEYISFAGVPDYRTFAIQNQGNNLFPATPIKIGRQTTINSGVPIWQLTMPDECVITVKATITAIVAGSAETATFHTTASFRRDGGGVATLVGTDEDVNIKTLFTVPSYTWSPTANDMRLLVNSGAVTTVNWVAEIECTKVSGV